MSTVTEIESAIKKLKPEELYRVGDLVDGLREELRPAKVRLERRGGYTVGVTDQPFDGAALKKALEEFP